MTGPHKARYPIGSAAFHPAWAAALLLGLLAAPSPRAQAEQGPMARPVAAGGTYLVRLPVAAPPSAPAPLLSFEQRDARGRLILRVTLGQPGVAPAIGTTRPFPGPRDPEAAWQGRAVWAPPTVLQGR